MEIIQQISEKFIQEIILVDICEGLTSGIASIKESVNTFVCRVLEQKLREIDQALCENRDLRKDWVIEHKDVERQLLTGYGLLQFSRRYYRNKKNKECRYLVDDIVGIAPRERLEIGLVADLCEKAADNSYAKSAQICCESKVSRQTVLRKTRKTEIQPVEITAQRTGVKIVHIQADEDHVAMQDGRRDTIVKLVAIHEEAVRIGKNRWQLPQRYLMSSYNEPVDDFWLRVADEIDRRYGDADDLTVYIHGDGANWIRSGTKWLKNSRFVLDKFHVRQMLNRVTKDSEGYKQYIWSQFDGGDRRKINEIVQACINEGICVPKTGIDFMNYINRNWDGIQIWYDTAHRAGGSCAEGLVSHVLSSRLSSRPCGWRDEGLETISQIRVHVLNGGKISPENIQRKIKPVIKKTQRLKKRLNFENYNHPQTMRTDHRSSAQYRLFKAITNGGHKIQVLHGMIS